MSSVNSTEGAGPEGSAAGSNLGGLLGGVNFDRERVELGRVLTTGQGSRLAARSLSRRHCSTIERSGRKTAPGLLRLPTTALSYGTNPLPQLFPRLDGKDFQRKAT